MYLYTFSKQHKMLMSQSQYVRFKSFYFSDTEFDNLMKNRIYHVLLISSNYDAFILEDDAG